MCGLLFEFSSSQTPDRESFEKVLSLSAKRGPDHTGYWTNNQSVQLGFNRLAILDLTVAGHQPMLSPKGRYAMVFNGEIYNHLKLRQQLEFRNFRGHSDTETISACIDEWGMERTVSSLDGMFALAVFDQQTGEVFLARDYAGIKPLFYGWDGKTLVAASQYDQVVQHPNFRNSPIDEQVLKLYLQQHFMPAPFGLMKNTFQVAPGGIIRITSDHQKIDTRYWDFPDFSEPSVTDREEAILAVSDSLEQAVKDQLLSDVPLGAFLSGGIDSPLICFYAKKVAGHLKTFTIGSDSAKHDESLLAEKFAALLKTQHLTSRMDGLEAESLMDEVLTGLHEPMADFSIVPTYLVSRLARQEVTVALSGDGGDELFFGYERFQSIAKNIRFQNWPWLVRAGLYKGDQFLNANKNVNSGVLIDRQGEAHQRLHSRFSDQWLEQLFPDLTHVDLPESYDAYEYPNTRSEGELIQRIRKAEFYGMMQKTLRKVDLASMENSLEVRVPFLQKSFIEASLKIDPFLSYGKNAKKQLLKDLLIRNIPDSPIDDVKRGFTVPLGHWMRKELNSYFRDRLSESSFLTSFGVSSQRVNELFDQHLSGKDLKWPIFTLTALSAWKKNVSV